MMMDYSDAKGIPGRDFPLFYFCKAFLSTSSANNAKTSGGIMTLFEYDKGGISIIKIIEDSHNTTIVHPTYILKTIEVAEMCNFFNFRWYFFEEKRIELFVR